MGLNNKRVDENGVVLCQNAGCQEEARFRSSYCCDECYLENNETEEITF